MIGVNIYAQTYPEKFKPAVSVLDVQSIGTVFALRPDDGNSSIFLSHDQMIDLRDVLTKAIAESPLKCREPGCEEEAERRCENCERRYCADHCSKGGDVEGGTNPNGSPYGAYAVPSLCDVCGDR